MTAQTDDIKELAGALAKAQAEIGGAMRDATNPHFRSKYADLGSVIDAAKPLSGFGIAYVQQVRAIDGELRLVTRLLHASGQWIEDGGIPLLLGKQDMQGLGSAMTYARRYGLMAACGIAPEDDDGNAASQGQGKPIAAKSATTPPGAEKAKAWVAAQKSILSGLESLQLVEQWAQENEKPLNALQDQYPTAYEDLDGHYASIRKAFNDATMETAQ